MQTPLQQQEQQQLQMQLLVDNDFLAIPTHPRMPPATTTTTTTTTYSSSPTPPTPSSSSSPATPPASITHIHSTPKPLPNRSNNDNNNNARAPKRYPCKFDGCGKDFSTSGHLSRHSRIHMGLKRFSCSVDGCDRTFVRADNRDQHDKSHRRRLSGNNNSYSCESDHAPPSPEASLVSTHHSIEVESCPSPVSPCSMQFVLQSLGHVSKASISFLID
ncbi:hypothetical protein CcCBS67573_g08694 [Chytriomyces confervae]|uniref:C2H2-type domain-containing protein n=1 Tax=Chytriomyces confervae TaxID=246404 RepID=A0A507EHZ0_9FUNG|nr:hypothetical protein CcCBS67573_g08694 [Chytriomyces confervae]